MQLLLEEGANTRMRSLEGLTVRDCAVQGGHESVMRILDDAVSTDDSDGNVEE